MKTIGRSMALGIAMTLALFNLKIVSTDWLFDGSLTGFVLTTIFYVSCGMCAFYIDWYIKLVKE